MEKEPILRCLKATDVKVPEMRELKVNPEYEGLLPKLPAEEYEALRESIRVEGLHYPIVVNEEGVILDGYHRYRICRELGIIPNIEVKTFGNKLQEKKFVIEANLRRRHLNDFQKAELAYSLLEIERALARERQKRTQFGFGGVQMNTTGKGKARDIVAKAAGLSPTTFQRAVKIIERGPEKLKEKVRHGKMSIAYAYKMILREEKNCKTPDMPSGKFNVICARARLNYRFYGGYPGYRLAGTPADHEAAKYILKKFVEFGLQDARLEPVDGWTLWLPKEWRLSIRLGEEVKEIPCGFRPYTAFTDPRGITAEMVYVGTGSDAEFRAKDVKGKIVLVDLIAPGLDNDFLLRFSFFAYDPENTLPGRKATQNWPVLNLVTSYDNAIKFEAAGYIGILNFLADGRNLYYSPYTGVLTSLPGLYVSRDVGLYLKGLLTTSSIEANMVLLGSIEPGLTYNVVGVLPGKEDEIILITSHHDGGAANDARARAPLKNIPTPLYSSSSFPHKYPTKSAETKVPVIVITG
jgi:hypothetical protein